MQARVPVPGPVPVPMPVPVALTVTATATKTAPDRYAGCPGDAGQFSWSTDRTLPAGSVNHAMAGPPSTRTMPFASASNPS